MQLSKACLPKFPEVVNASQWPACWIAPKELPNGSIVIAYRLLFDLEQDATIRIHISADQRYRFFVDGQLEGEGPDRGDLHAWYFQSYELNLSAGRHCLSALVWSIEQRDGLQPAAQISMRHAFIVAADSPHTHLLSTGIAAWESKVVRGIRFVHCGMGGAGTGAGAAMEIDGADFPQEAQFGEGEGWKPTATLDHGRSRLSSTNWGLLQGPLLTPSRLPPQTSTRHRFKKLRFVGRLPERVDPIFVDQAQRLTEKEAVFQRALEATEPLHIEAGEQIWLLIDLEDYFCGYPEITVEGGAGSSIKLLWAESLFEESVSIGSLRRQRKGNRNEIMEKFMIGRGDFFRVGEREEPSSFSSLWWSCGRYVALLLETGSEPLKITYLGFRDSRYPFELAASIQLGNDDFERSKALMWRSLQMCSHETYMDCPYYEQLNYAGDTRVQALVTYVTSGDDRLARKCIALLAHSALPNGLVQARYPCWTSQTIPQFSLYWVGLLHDFAAWRGDSAFLKPFLPQARSIIDTFLNHVAQDGLLRCPHGWDWIDWNPSWTGGRHHQGPEGASSVNHLQLIYAIRQAAQLERWVGRASFAEDLDASCRELWDRAVKAFWNEGRGLFAATTTHEHFGEHAQCFAVLSGLMDQDSKERMATSLVESTDLVRASYYFRFYLFEACASLGRLDHVLRLFGSWGEMADLGLKTTIESMEPSRSDCHAWSSHPLYHAVTSFGGIRPDGFGFNRVRISPAVDVLDSANICMPHPQGDLRVRWSRRGSDLTVEVSLPEGLDGTIELDRHHHPLTAGPAKFEVNRGVINRLG